MYKSWLLVDADEANVKANTVSSPREELNVHMWAWDATILPSPTKLSCGNRQIDFHPGYSAGTSAARGDTPFVRGHDYFWEIKMLTSMYGTDVMVGIGTAQCQLDEGAEVFCSLLGLNKESWGFSYNGELLHNGVKECYGSRFNMNDIVGVHLDMWHGNLSFYLNGKPLGIAYESINCHEPLYPMVCSTAAHSSMKLIYAYSCPTSLQNICLQTLSVQQLNYTASVPGLSRLPRQQLLDNKAFDSETILLPDEKLRIVQDTGFQICNANETGENSSHVRTVFNVRQQRKRQMNLNRIGLNKVLTVGNAGRSTTMCNFAMIAGSSAMSRPYNLNIRNDDGCKLCGAKYRTNENSVRQTLRPLARRVVANSLCNNCGFIF